MPDAICTAATADDYPRLLDLNDGAVPAVNRIDAEALARLHREALALLVARSRETGLTLGFLLALPEHATYASPNFQYFRRNYPRFAYVDRVVVDPAARGRGIGTTLYRALFERCASTPLVTCEVNIEPPNPGSMAFHLGLGFRQVGEQRTEGGSKRVALLTLALADDARP